MEIKIVNFSSKNLDRFIPVIRDILQNEFKALPKLYEEIRIVIGSNKDIKKGKFNKEVSTFLGRQPISLTKPIFDVRSTMIPPKAIIEINLSKYSSFKDWKRKLSIRHEVCHLLCHEEETEAFRELKKKFSINYLKNFVRYHREYCAHNCIIERYPEDWLREPIGFKENTQPPKNFHESKKEKEGRKMAVYRSIAHIFNLLRTIYLYEKIPANLEFKINTRKEIAQKFLKEFFIEVQRDTTANLPLPRKWLTPKDFLSGEIYFRKVKTVLELVD